MTFQSKHLIAVAIGGAGIIMPSMRTRVVLPATVALLALAVLRAQAPLPAPSPLLVTGARILDASTGKYVSAPFVFIENGRIASIGAHEPNQVAATAERLDVAGATLVPGLVDVHAALSPTPDLDADYFNLMALAHGVTASRALNLRTTWAVAQRRRATAAETESPRLWVGGRGFDQGARPDLWLFDAGDTRAGAHEVARQVAVGVDWVAGYDHLPPDLYRAMVMATQGKPTRVSAMPGMSSMSDLAAAGVASIETLDWPLAPRKPASDLAAADRAWTEASTAELNGLVRRLVTARVTLVPLLAGSLVRAYPAELTNDAGLSLLPVARRDALLAQTKAVTRTAEVAARRAFAAKGRFLSSFVRATGVVAAGSGFDLAGYPPPGAGVHAELVALVRAGLTPAEAIRAATTNAAVMLGADQVLGAIAVGRDADLLIVSGDPLANVADLAKISHVIRRGEVLDPKGLRERALRARR